MNWILILMVHHGLYASDGANSLAMTNLPGFATKEECEAAGEASRALVKSTIKDVRYVCVSQRTKI